MDNGSQKIEMILLQLVDLKLEWKMMIKKVKVREKLREELKEKLREVLKEKLREELKEKLREELKEISMQE